ncbi:hypothetical protein DEO72_LG3g1794 [Vigna unguiculata]|uniref:Uncharacterized protein n=1 Tax=Vigna unguiculata TaxID=3917 RepID=A0A4D6LFH9_VIGUN|nr:hypothetical protein DEO72_LG3g1794 [Vigna unguiculata]
MSLEEMKRKKLELEETLRKMEVDALDKDKTWKAKEDKLANDVAMTYDVRFEVALEQVRLLCPSIDISGVDANKVVIDGRLVEE